MQLKSPVLSSQFNCFCSLEGNNNTNRRNMANLSINLLSQFQHQVAGKLPDIICGCGLSLNNLDVESRQCYKPFSSSDKTSKILAIPSEPSPCFSQAELKVKQNSQDAVSVNKVCKTYGGCSSTGIKVLDNFSMKIPTGAIYSLLGSSGCGKTTILQCVIGLKRIDSGSISVLGVSSSDEEQFLKIRPHIGYMPQELALYDHLTVKEIMRYYGKLYGMTPEVIVERWRTLGKLLNLLPKRYEQIKDLSGGTKRRVSLALALLNNPKLLILDEPTVGMDPMLRKSIWEHLYDLISNKKTTICITTHFVEETRFSSKVGIMRSGRLIAEDSPQSLLSAYHSNFLQDVILQICKKDQMLSKNNYNIAPLNNDIDEGQFNEVQFFYNGKTSPRSSIDLPDAKFPQDTVAFCGFKLMGSDGPYYQNRNGFLVSNGDSKFIHDAYKERRRGYIDTERVTNFKDGLNKSMTRSLSFATVMWIYLMRQPIFAFILVFLPAVQLLMTFFVVGRTPLNLKVAVINEEANEFAEKFGYNVCQNMSLGHNAEECDLTFLSCHIQNDLAKNPKLNLVKESEREAAEQMIQQGSLLGYLAFPKNYSQNLVNRFITGKFASDNDTLEGSMLHVTIEKSHYLAYYIILQEVLDSLDSLSKNIGVSCGFDNSYNDVPLNFRKPVYGKLDGTHQESIIPAIVAQILFEILYGIAPMILIKDLRQGTFIRNHLAGLQFFEFLLGIFGTMAPILIIQSVSCYAVLQYGFGFQVRGSFFLFILLCLLAGLCGQGFGIFMGILVKSEFSVIVSAIMVVPIIMTCSGTLWPIESHPYYLTVIYYIFPSALIVSSLRSVINRGVGITHALVWPGLVNTLSWSIAFWLLSIYGLRRMTKS